MTDHPKINKRDFLKKAGVAAVGAGALAAPNVVRAQAPIKWRLQTYAGASLAEHVIKPSIDAFNNAANGEMVIELYTADQLVPQGELFRAVQNGTIDAAQSDDDSMAAPIDVSVFGAYFPFASRYSLDVPVLWEWYGLREIWEEAYAEVPGVTWLSTGSWDPCNFVTTKPIRSVADLKGLRVFTFPTGGKFLERFGVVPVTLPWEDIEVAIQTNEIDGVAWCGATETYTVGWADITKYYLTNNISGAWAGSYIANTQKWEALPEHLKTLFKLSMDSSHYYRQHWYWWGEAHYRTTGGKLELTTIPEAEWATIETEALKFWDEVAQKSPRNAKVVEILKKYADTMKKAGAPYRYG
ncbi:TRAP transporter substrate-binding protein [Parvibaculum sp.]|uniref:TRAP transporter substrate-binding protein n=1 Tax=Parvibaculum sp. TaxID=2024848 RepID=UPI0027282C84|nr:TRAP transporter substrate-binding protein [Parvibaculum sp.]MDO9127568.1 TRAP transporter substrate-binding protein [Parvibaculum sp.]MDP1627738.1 TRAP transporter substrate-binding protein [Parvibaculum sp.]MDP2150736.1 TRAP transporter substrate-binding protein [Parvibaculum sp.]MDP3327991.1 TRAP transporter substrate-binding protein [Parvibaculum sp.]